MIYVLVSITVLALGLALFLWAKLEKIKELISQVHFETFSGGGPGSLLAVYNKLWAWAGLEEKGAPRGGFQKPSAGGGPREPDDRTK